MSCGDCGCDEEHMSQEEQLSLLTNPNPGRTVDNEEELLKAEFGEPDVEGVYDGRS